VSVPDPAQILRTFDAALNAHDLEAAMDLFADDAVVRYVPPPPRPARAVYTGKEEIRGLMQALIAEGYNVEAERYEVDGGRVTSRDRRVFAARHEQLGGNPVVVTCEATVRAGRIEAMTICFSPESSRRIEAAIATRG
jgi:hypothetical protein